MRIDQLLLEGFRQATLRNWDLLSFLVLGIGLGIAVSRKLPGASRITGKLGLGVSGLVFLASVLEFTLLPQPTPLGGWGITLAIISNFLLDLVTLWFAFAWAGWFFGPIKNWN